jgi:beta-xylosidase
MKKFYSILLVALVFSACSSPEASSPTQTNTLVTAPVDTPVPTTPTMEARPTPLPSPTPDPMIFRDDFNSAFESGWQWIREDANLWSMSNNPGWLEIMAVSGYVINGDMDNVLVRPAPDGDFELETRIKFKPLNNFQIAGLLIFENPTNYMLFGRAYCDAQICADDGYYFDFATRGVYLSENFARAAAETETVYFRLRREGNEFTGYASENRLDWLEIGTHVGDIDPLFVGLATGQTDPSEPILAQFDYFMITALP